MLSQLQLRRGALFLNELTWEQVSGGIEAFSRVHDFLSKGSEPNVPFDVSAYHTFILKRFSSFTNHSVSPLRILDDLVSTWLVNILSAPQARLGFNFDSFVVFETSVVDLSQRDTNLKSMKPSAALSILPDDLLSWHRAVHVYRHAACDFRDLNDSQCSWHSSDHHMFSFP
jgi:hypothetical protein